ncbi:MAG: hypothetical protein PVG40_13220 [Desulfobacterales bacterium]|jgi:hypothetical protein
MEPAHRAKVRKREEAVADVIRRTHRPDRKTRAAEDPAAEAARAADRAAVKAAAEAGESDLNAILIILRIN